MVRIRRRVSALASLAVASGIAAACSGGGSTEPASGDEGGTDSSLGVGAETGPEASPAADVGAGEGPVAPDATDTGSPSVDATAETSSPDGAGDSSLDAAPESARDALALDAADGAAPACVEGSQGPSGAATWAEGFATSGTIDSMQIALDPQGNVFAFGDFQGTINFTGSPSGNLVSAGLKDVFLAKFDSSGHPLWSQRFGNAATQYGAGVAADPSGNVYVVGSFYSGIAFDGSADAGSYAHAYSQSTGFVAKFDPDGHYIWSHEVGNGSGYEFLYGVALDPGGGVTFSGGLQGSVSLAKADGGVDTFTSAGANDVLVFKLGAADGSYQWGRAFGDSSDQASPTLGSDAAGNLYVAGYTTGSIPLGTAGTLNAGSGAGSAFLIKLASDGSPQWGRALSGSADVGGEQAVAVTPQGDAYLAMSSHGAVGLVGTDAGVTSVPNSGSTDVVVARFDTSGAYLWGRGYGDSSTQGVGAVAVDGDGAVFVTGFFQGALTPASADAGTGYLASPGGTEAFLVKIDAAGDYRWGRAFGGSSTSAGTGVALAGCSPVVAGTYAGDIAFAGAGDAGSILVPGSDAGGAAGYLTSLVP